MRTKTKFLTTTGPRRARGRGVLVFVFLALLAGLGWLASRQGWLSVNRSARTNEASGLTREEAISIASGTLPTNALKPVWRTLSAATNILTTSSNAPSVLEAQIALDRLAISPGSIDGVAGSQTRAALRAFQSREALPLTGELDSETRARLRVAAAALGIYRIETGDLVRLRPLATTWLGKSEQGPLDYETLLELVAERSHAHPSLIRRLNGAVDWNAVAPGVEVLAPIVERGAPRTKAAWLQIRLGARTLQAFDAANRLLAHFPCSIAQRVDKRPVGELHVAVIAPNPDYTFNPELFPESAEARELKTKLKLQPGPNNPVGTVWIGLNLPGYGIHGTPRPEDVGRTESHGCFRLANWNAEYLLQLVTIGTPVRVEP